MGAATSTATFVRSIGGSFGTALFGAIFAARLTAELASALPAGAGMPTGDVTASLSRIDALPGPLREAVLGAFSSAISFSFLVAVPIMAISFLLALMLKESPLRTHQDVAHILADDAASPLPVIE